MTEHPIYSDQPPSEPGLYWFRLGSSNVDRFCRVWRDHRGRLVASTSEGLKEVDKFRRRWAGPLPEPTEAVKG